MGMVFTGIQLEFVSLAPLQDGRGSLLLILRLEVETTEYFGVIMVWRIGFCLELCCQYRVF
jgi:hypothetical protein